MKFALVNICLILIHFSSFGQKVISINTSFYGTKEIYRELYLSSDSVFLEEYRLRLATKSHKLTKMPDRQDFLYVNENTFKLILKEIMKKNDNISEVDFPKPFAEIYYVKFRDYKRKKTVITSAFGDDRNRALNYFSNLRDQFRVNDDTQPFIQKLESIIASLKIERG